MNWPVYLGLGGTFIGAFMVIVLPFIAVGPQKARILLAGLFLLLVLYGVGTHLTMTGGYQRMPHLMRVGSTALFLLGPLLYLYGRSLAFPDKTWSARDLLHGLPLLVDVAFRLPFFLSSAQVKLALSRTGMADPWDLFRNRSGALLVMGAYLIALLRLKRRHEAVLLQQHSRLTGRHLTWLLWIAFAWGSIPVLDCLSLASSQFGWQFPFCLSILAAYTGTWVGALTLGTAFLGLIMPSISFGSREVVSVVSELPVEPVFLDEACTEDAHESRLLARVQAYMEIQHPYLQSDLSLGELARRIQEAKQQLRDQKESKTILEIAHASGFASKSTFNDVFKRLCSMTPGEFQRAKVAADEESGRPER